MQQFYNWFFANLNNMLIFINSYDNIFILALMVKRLIHRPLTAKSGVRFPLRVPFYLIKENSLIFFIIRPRNRTPPKRGSRVP